jgi:hypothetical protein
MSAADIVAPEVRLFLARVRHELADLDPQEVEEITDGLEADLTELVADRGSSALGSPVEYAAELRAAAGLAVDGRPAGRSRRQQARVAVEEFLDGAHARFDALVALLPGDQRPLLAWLRPLWWVARAWIAVVAGVGVLKDAAGYSNAYYVPDVVAPVRGFGWPVLLVAVVISVQIGRGRIWPGDHRGTGGRIVLLALNVLALALIPVALASVRNEPDYVPRSSSVAAAGPVHQGLVIGSRQVTNIYPYDASGRPLVGVQLFDQDGQPIEVRATGLCHIDGQAGWSSPGPNERCFDPEAGGVAGLWRVFYPWTNGATEVKNVFPMPSRTQESRQRSTTAFAESDPPQTGEFPQARVPAVSLPGIVASLQRTGAKAQPVK